MDRTNEGALFTSRRKSGPNDPDFTGSVVLSPDLLEKLVIKRNRGEEIRLSVAGWKNQSKDGKSYLRVRLREDTYHAGAPKQGSPAPNYQNAAPGGGTGGYPQRSAPPAQAPLYSEGPQKKAPWEDAF